ncbi:MAG: ribosomal RNA small subunit methyltransferase I [Rhodospirillales bacterium]
MARSRPCPDSDGTADSRQRRQSSKSPSGPDALAPGLYLVATPVGNAEDLSLRALQVLQSVDAIACEDTRVTARLLAIREISRPLRRYDEHTADKARTGAAGADRCGRAHRPCQRRRHAAGFRSERLVRACIDAGLPLTAVPGPSAPLAALNLSGLPTRRFLFAGYLAPRRQARRRELAELADVAATLVLLESPQRLAAALADMAEVLGPRGAAVAQTLTKLFEEVRRGPLGELAARYYRRAAEGR